MDADIGAATGEVTPAKRPGHTAPPKATGGASREYAVASGVLVDASLKGVRHARCCSLYMAKWQHGVDVSERSVKIDAAEWGCSCDAPR